MFVINVVTILLNGTGTVWPIGINGAFVPFAYAVIADFIPSFTTANHSSSVPLGLA